MGDPCENTVKLRELGRYLDHSPHVHHIYERKRKYVDCKLEKAGRKNSILSKLNLLRTSFQRVELDGKYLMLVEYALLSGFQTALCKRGIFQELCLGSSRSAHSYVSAPPPHLTQGQPPSPTLSLTENWRSQRNRCVSPSFCR